MDEISFFLITWIWRTKKYCIYGARGGGSVLSISFRAILLIIRNALVIFISFNFFSIPHSVSIDLMDISCLLFPSKCQRKLFSLNNSIFVVLLFHIISPTSQNDVTGHCVISIALQSLGAFVLILFPFFLLSSRHFSLFIPSYWVHRRFLKTHWFYRRQWQWFNRHWHYEAGA